MATPRKKAASSRKKPRTSGKGSRPAERIEIPFRPAPDFRYLPSRFLAHEQVFNGENLKASELPERRIEHAGSRSIPLAAGGLQPGSNEPFRGNGSGVVQHLSGIIL